MKISIIIPVYNAEQYLRECLDSLVNQTWRDIEIILINDGSTDSSGRICEDYLNDPRVIYRGQENAGPSAARNLGLSLATGDYIAFVDADDWLELDAMERLQQESADIVLFNYFRGDERHTDVGEDGLFQTKQLYLGMIAYVNDQGTVAYTDHNLWMRLFRRKLIKDNGIRFDPRFNNGEDLLFTLQATFKSVTISVRNSDYLYHYRQTQNSLTSRYVCNFWKLRKQIISELFAIIQDGELLMQMPLRIFSWAVAGIENELRYPQGSLDRIRQIVNDPICDTFKGKLDSSRFNAKNQRYYRYICASDADGIWRDYQRRVRFRKRQKLIKRIKQRIRMLLHI